MDAGKRPRGRPEGVHGCSQGGHEDVWMETVSGITSVSQVWGQLG